MKVSITPWAIAEESEVYTHIQWVSGNGYDTHSRESVVLDHECCDVIKAAHAARLFQNVYSEKEFELFGDCIDFKQKVEPVLEYDDEQVAEVREQLSEFGENEIDKLNNWQVAYIDHGVREILANNARSVTCPWSSKDDIVRDSQSEMSQFVVRYLTKRYPVYLVEPVDA